MIDCEKDFGLEPGTQLVQCSKGFTWNETISSMSPRMPNRVTVIKEYPRFIEVEADFTADGGKKYRESINKAAYFGGDCWFKKLERGN